MFILIPFSSKEKNLQGPIRYLNYKGKLHRRKKDLCIAIKIYRDNNMCQGVLLNNSIS